MLGALQTENKKAFPCPSDTLVSVWASHGFSFFLIQAKSETGSSMREMLV